MENVINRFVIIPRDVADIFGKHNIKIDKKYSYKGFSQFCEKNLPCYYCYNYPQREILINLYGQDLFDYNSFNDNSYTMYIKNHEGRFFIFFRYIFFSEETDLLTYKMVAL